MLIEVARERARTEQTTLNQQFRRWLESCARRQERVQRYDQVVNSLQSKLRVGGKLKREEMNER